MKKIFTVSALVGIIIVSVLRSLDYVLYFDEASGFFGDNALLSLIALIVAAVITVLGAVLISRKLPSAGEYSDKRNIPLGIVSVLCSLGFFYSTYAMYFEHINLVAMNITETTAMGISMRIPVIILSGLVGVYMLIAAYASFTGKNIFTKAPVLPLIFVVWALLFTLFIFMHYSISVLHTENAFIILSAVLASYSLLQYALFVSKVGNKCLRKLVIWAVPFSVMSVSFAVSSFVKLFYGIEAKGDVPFYVLILMFSAGIFMLTFVITMDYNAEGIEKQGHYRAKRYRK